MSGQYFSYTLAKAIKSPLAWMVLLCFTSLPLLAQIRLVPPKKLIQPIEFVFISGENTRNLVLTCELSNPGEETRILFTSSAFSLDAGLSKGRGIQWNSIDTVHATERFDALAWRDSLLTVDAVITRSGDTLFHEQFSMKHSVSYVHHLPSSGDSLRLWMDPAVKASSLDLEVFTVDSNYNQVLSKDEVREFACDSFQVNWQGERLYGFSTAIEKTDLTKHKQDLPDLPDIPFFEFNGIQTSFSMMLADTGIQSLPMQLPLYRASNSTRFSVAGIPIKADFSGYAAADQPFETLFTGRGTYFNVSYDKESLPSVPQISPDDPRLKEAISASSLELLDHRRMLEERSNKLLEQAALPKMPGDTILQTPDSSAWMPSSRGLPDTSKFIDDNKPAQIDTSQLSWLDQARLRRLEKKINETSREEEELRAFYGSLDSLKQSGVKVGRGDIPRSMDEISAENLFNPAKLSRLEELQFGSLVPHRFGKSTAMFMELFGASAIVHPVDGINVYALVARNRRDGFIPQPDYEVFEGGVASTRGRLKASAILSLERTPQWLGFIDTASGEAIDRLLPTSYSNVIFDLEYDIFDHWSLGVSHIQPISDMHAWSPWEQRTRVYTRVRIKTTDIDLYGEQFPEQVYTNMDFGAILSAYKMGGVVATGFFNQQIRLKLGYEAMTGSQSDSGKTLAHAPIAQLDIAFRQFPSLSLAYMPFSNATSYFDPTTAQLITQNSQTAVYNGLLSYNRPIGNLMWTALGSYTRVENSVVYSLMPDMPAYEGKVETGRLQFMAHGKRFSFGSTSQYLRQQHEQWMQSTMLKFGLTPTLTLGAEASVAYAARLWFGTASGIIEWKIKGITLSINAGSYLGNKGPNPFARFSVSHRFMNKRN